MTQNTKGLSDAVLIPPSENTMPISSPSQEVALPDVTGNLEISTRFQPGVSGNPAGRPRGARNRFTEKFMSTLMTDFSEHGADALATLRAKDPEVYFRLIIALLPKSLVMKYEQSYDIDLAALSNEEIVQMLETAKRENFVRGVLESASKD